MTQSVCEAPPREREGGFHVRFFDALLKRHLIFNTSWEDPALDRQALALGPEDRVLAITGAGDNVLDYLLAGAGEVHAVDLNPCQTALLELKVAAARTLCYEEFFELFGRGRTASRAAGGTATSASSRAGHGTGRSTTAARAGSARVSSSASSGGSGASGRASRRSSRRSRSTSSGRSTNRSSATASGPPG
jgi:S-adenosylmethionine-diacylglycerol 3-amino-3-carboxypropyl transferase